jgi:predicted nucleic acid-binding protein
MTYVIDTNVLSALLSAEDNAHAIATTLHALSASGTLVIHGSVYAELLASPGNTTARLDTFLSRTNIGVDWQVSREIWQHTGRAYATYARRRTRAGGGRPRRILADFLIGAHAQSREATLVTLDDQHYRTSFPQLTLLVP